MAETDEWKEMVGCLHHKTTPQLLCLYNKFKCLRSILQLTEWALKSLHPTQLLCILVLFYTGTAKNFSIPKAHIVPINSSEDNYFLSWKCQQYKEEVGLSLPALSLHLSLSAIFKLVQYLPPLYMHYINTGNNVYLIRMEMLFSNKNSFIFGWPRRWLRAWCVQHMKRGLIFRKEDFREILSISTNVWWGGQSDCPWWCPVKGQPWVQQIYPEVKGTDTNQPEFLFPSCDLHSHCCPPGVAISLPGCPSTPPRAALWIRLGNSFGALKTAKGEVLYHDKCGQRSLLLHLPASTVGRLLRLLIFVCNIISSKWNHENEIFLSKKSFQLSPTKYFLRQSRVLT